ncbi:ectonucleotide pyrophosphatase/phosphodiesterase family member 6 [Eurytemora carolleeae]|uniref:ectonucleotide pyrophosphatase/phosphodiesterase family member 6 n=1 Tax=Eurytemora carolleeae TaxID=1294199 RepID=UPI000C75626E|nr:ectonucleotide pyrophosphatase/phosphodiesterase family member 6 [Eurytemora carolleeae]|eukprot:XP_023326978.1 ectonucleotide pyrophosphatase/phosphodiesterase family member 6-like [Eurytemora affinis]
MQFHIIPLVLLVALVSLPNCTLVNGENSVESAPSQIERPPAEAVDSEEDDEDEENAGEHSVDFDVDYNVHRPADQHTQIPKCKTEDLHEGDVNCEIEVKPKLKPYINYKGYHKWERRPLFVIIIGGLRWDYLTEEFWNGTNPGLGNLKAFNWIQKHGATMSQVIPVFPPYDLPTWTSLATGLYPHNTGVTGDYMYNLKTRELFSRDDSLESWWVSGEPIWSTAAKHGRKVSVLNWHDCTLAGNTLEDPNDCKPFHTKSGMPSKQKLIQLFNQAFTKIHSADYDLSIVYTDALKKAALTYGPNSQEVKNTLADLDDVLQGRLSDIKNKKERANLKLNILLLSDYGLNSRANTTKLVLEDYMEFEHVQYIIQRGGSVVLIPYALKAGDILNGVAGKLGVGSMLGIDVYVRDVNLQVPPLEYPTIPEYLHYSGHTWTQDILLVAKPGFEIEVGNASEKLLPPMKEPQVLGTSGYIPDPPPPLVVPGRDKHKSKELRAREKVEGELYHRFAHMMKTVGFAWGPDFKPGHVSSTIEIVDIYQIMAFLLQVDPQPHDGSWDRVKPMIVLSSGENLTPVLFLSLLSSILLLKIY